MGAFFFRQFQALLRAGGSENLQAHRPGILRRGRADASAGAMNQHSLSGTRVRMMNQRGDRGSVRNPNSRSLSKRDFFGQGMHLGFERQGIFCIRAAHRPCGVNSCAGLELGNALTHSFDDASGIGAGRVRQRRLDRVSSVAHVSVIGIHAGGMYAHQDLARSRFGRRDFLQL